MVRRNSPNPSTHAAGHVPALPRREKRRVRAIGEVERHAHELCLGLCAQRKSEEARALVSRVEGAWRRSAARHTLGEVERRRAHLEGQTRAGSSA